MKRLALLTAGAISIGVHAANPEVIESTFRTSKGAEYSVRLGQAPMRGTAKLRSFGYWGREGAVPATCVSSMKITRNGKAVDIPDKMIVDLCNVHSVDLSEANGRVVVKLQGGDGGDSFNAEFRFAGVYLTDRWVRHGEFPEEAYEHTRFRYNTEER